MKNKKIKFSPVVEYNNKKYTVLYETIIVEIIENNGAINYIEEMNDDIISAIEKIILYDLKIDECFKEF